MGRCFVRGLIYKLRAGLFGDASFSGFPGSNKFRQWLVYVSRVPPSDEIPNALSTHETSKKKRYSFAAPNRILNKTIHQALEVSLVMPRLRRESLSELGILNNLLQTFPIYYTSYSVTHIATFNLMRTTLNYRHACRHGMQPAQNVFRGVGIIYPMSTLRTVSGSILPMFMTALVSSPHIIKFTKVSQIKLIYLVAAKDHRNKL